MAIKLKNHSYQIPESNYLFVEVFQNGISQNQKKFQLNKFIKKKIFCGSKISNSLSLPMAEGIRKIKIFEIGRNCADIFIDPRFTGFLNIDEKFGDINEFISPRGALGPVASPENPFKINLKSGSRGLLKFNGYEIAFKIEKPFVHKEPAPGVLFEKNFFQLPSYDMSIERNIIPISVMLASMMIFSGLFWIFNSPTNNTKGFLRLPTRISNHLVAAENLRLLPYIYGEKFDPENAIPLSLLWVHELFMRWESADQGSEYTSMIPFLNTVPTNKSRFDLQPHFINDIKNNYKFLDQSKINLSIDRYYNHIEKSPQFFSHYANNFIGSNNVVLQRRMEQLKKIDAAILTYLYSEHLILKDYYAKNHDAKKLSIVEPPQTGQVLGRQPDPIFNVELKNYKAVEELAEFSENSFYQEKMHKQKNFQNSVMFTNDSLVLPSFLRNQHAQKYRHDEDFEIVLKNALYSTGAIALTPNPLPKPYIDFNAVNFVVYNKKEELKSCYNSALRRNSKLTGILDLSWTINESGKAQEFINEDGLNDKYLLQCMKSRILEWNFPKAKHGAVAVDYSFNFKQSKSNE